MVLQTFKAPTIAQAISQVKTTLGHNAVILHTRTYQQRQWLGLRRREIVEITAGRSPKGKTAALRPVSRSIPAGHGVTSLPAQPGRKLMETPAASSAALLTLTQEMNALKTVVKDLVCHTRQTQAPGIPDELFDFYLTLQENAVEDSLAADIIKTLRLQLRPEHLAQSQFVKDKLVEQIEKLIPVSGPITRTKSAGPHVVALIGPTGVGKTTTIAKLAANLKLREKRRVGLITMDTYRIAAIDQLKKYAELIGSPLRVVATPDDLTQSVRLMDDFDFILIDTAGRSPNDTLKLNELRSVLGACEPDEVHLVLSTTASQECVELAVNRFSDVRVDKLIFTKLDEAVHVGLVLNVVRKLNKSLSYITTGQNVPADIEVSRPRRLAQLILGNAL